MVRLGCAGMIYVWYGTVRYSTVTLLHGMVWYGLVRYGIVWYGYVMVWYGTVRLWYRIV